MRCPFFPPLLAAHLIACGGTSSGGLSCDEAGDPPTSPNGPPPAWTAREREEPTTCTSSAQGDTIAPRDECSCGDLRCDPGESCRLVYQQRPVGADGPDDAFNGCFELCQSDAECAAPEVCVGNHYGLKVCAEVECRVDADCSADPCGACAPGYEFQHTLLADPSASRCVYSGACGADSCAGCSNASTDWHHCAP